MTIKEQITCLGYNMDMNWSMCNWHDVLVWRSEWYDRLNRIEQIKFNVTIAIPLAIKDLAEDGYMGI